jgi:hypothetical protein
LKQRNAIAKFLELMESDRFVNPQSRRDLFAELKQRQVQVYEQRKVIVEQMVELETENVNKDIIEKFFNRLQELNDNVQAEMDKMVGLLNKDMENTNEDADLAFFDLKDFVLKNEA